MKTSERLLLTSTVVAATVLGYVYGPQLSGRVLLGWESESPSTALPVATLTPLGAVSDPRSSLVGPPDLMTVVRSDPTISFTASTPTDWASQTAADAAASGLLPGGLAAVLLAAPLGEPLSQSLAGTPSKDADDDADSDGPEDPIFSDVSDDAVPTDAAGASVSSVHGDLILSGVSAAAQAGGASAAMQYLHSRAAQGE